MFLGETQMHFNALLSLLSFLQQSTPDTSKYMLAGYVIFFTALTLYPLSLYLRHRNLQKDLELLDDLDN
jgi:hypothetical protein